MPKLKVYRTAIGFHDAYVAAPSMKAALAAWGVEANLFARGQAEIVDDAALTEEPLAKPGEVIKRLRGTAAEHFAALGPPPKRAAPPAVPQEPADKPKKPTRAAKPAPPPKPKPAPKPEPPPKPPPPPRPDRAKLTAAEATLTEAEQRHAAERAAMKQREAELREEQRRTAAAHRRELEKLQTARDRADAAYASALKRWREKL